MGIAFDKKLGSKMPKRFVMCFNGDCEKSEFCLRFQALKHVDGNDWNILCCNPNYFTCSNRTDDCFLTMDKKTKVRGFMALLDDIPHGKLKEIRRKLMARFGHGGYYRRRNGITAIDSKERRLIETICRECGYTAQIEFDKTEEDYQW